jgi:hypothetical protein
MLRELTADQTQRVALLILAERQQQEIQAYPLLTVDPTEPLLPPPPLPEPEPPPPPPPLTQEEMEELARQQPDPEQAIAQLLGLHQQ